LEFARGKQRDWAAFGHILGDPRCLFTRDPVFHDPLNAIPVSRIILLGGLYVGLDWMSERTRNLCSLFVPLLRTLGLDVAR
jgi:hypothetical protein